MKTTQARTLTDRFLAGVRAVPGGEKIDQCLQCGTCSASCPTSHAMAYPPRSVVAAARAGMLDRVLASNTVWFCASCYACSARCPAGIPLTDVMYGLKRLAVEEGFDRGGVGGAAMAKAFVRVVDRYGRNSEGALLKEYFLSTSPWGALPYLPLAWRLYRRGRLGLRPHRISGIKELRKMMAAMAKGESK